MYLLDNWITPTIDTENKYSMTYYFHIQVSSTCYVIFSEIILYDKKSLWDGIFFLASLVCQVLCQRLITVSFWSKTSGINMNTPTYQKKNPTFFYQNLIIVQRILWSCLNIAPPEAQIHSRMRTQIVDQFIKHKN